MSALRSLLSHLKEFVISASLVFVLGSDSSVQMEWCRCAEPTLNHSGTLPALTLSSTFHNVLASLICALLSVGDASYLLHGSWTLNFFELLPRSARHKTEAHDHGNFRLWVGSSLLFFQAVCCVTGFSVTFLCSFSFFIRQANLSDMVEGSCRRHLWLMFSTWCCGNSMQSLCDILMNWPSSSLWQTLKR